MYFVLLRFSTNRDQAGRFAAAHNDWLERGFRDGVFLLVGGIQPGGGGAIVAHNTSLAQLRSRVEDDPFVAAGVVGAEIVEIAPWKTHERLDFLLDQADA